MMRVRLCLLLLITALLGVPAVAWSQDQPPDRRGEAITREPAYNGTRARAEIPARYHVRNEGGSDGAGLCVIASILANGQSQGIPELLVPGAGRSNVPGAYDQVADAPGKGSLLWRTAKNRPGGYYPGKLSDLLNQVMPDEKWASYYGRDPRILDRLSRQGYPIGATMNTGRQYGYRRIAHMVSLAHYQTGGTACVADNNFPGVYSWMPAAEFDHRWVGSDGNGWAFWWLRLPDRSSAVAALSLPLAIATAATLVLSALLLLVTGLLWPTEVTDEAA